MSVTLDTTSGPHRETQVLAFPRTVLVEAEQERRIGRLADELFSFVGACAQGRIRSEAPRWVERWKEAGVEALFLVPV